MYKGTRFKDVTGSVVTTVLWTEKRVKKYRYEILSIKSKSQWNISDKGLITFIYEKYLWINKKTLIYSRKTNWQKYEGDPKKLEFIYKKLCIYFYMFKLQSPSNYSPFDAIHLSRLFSTAQSSFWTRQFWYLLVLLLVFFVSPLPQQQNISLWGLFSSGKTKQNKSCSGQDQVNTEGGLRGHAIFWSRTAEHSAWCGQVRSYITHHEMGNSIERVFQKKLTEAKHSLSQQCQLVHGYRCFPRTLV